MHGQAMSGKDAPLPYAGSSEELVRLPQPGRQRVEDEQARVPGPGHHRVIAQRGPPPGQRCLVPGDAGWGLAQNPPGGGGGVENAEARRDSSRVSMTGGV